MSRSARTSLLVAWLAVAGLAAGGCDVRAGEGGFSIRCRLRPGIRRVEEDLHRRGRRPVRGQEHERNGHDRAGHRRRAPSTCGPNGSSKASSDEAAQGILKQLEMHRRGHARRRPARDPRAQELGTRRPRGPVLHQGAEVDQGGCAHHQRRRAAERDRERGQRQLGERRHQGRGAVGPHRCEHHQRRRRHRPRIVGRRRRDAGNRERRRPAAAPARQPKPTSRPASSMAASMSTTSSGSSQTGEKSRRQAGWTTERRRQPRRALDDERRHSHHRAIDGCCRSETRPGCRSAVAGMNEDKSSRYHRLQRRASIASFAWSAALLVALASTSRICSTSATR